MGRPKKQRRHALTPNKRNTGRPRGGRVFVNRLSIKKLKQYDVLNLCEIAEILGVTRQTVSYWAREQGLPYTTIRLRSGVRKYQIEREGLIDWLVETDKYKRKTNV